MEEPWAYDPKSRFLRLLEALKRMEDNQSPVWWKLTEAVFEDVRVRKGPSDEELGAAQPDVNDTPPWFSGRRGSSTVRGEDDSSQRGSSTYSGSTDSTMSLQPLPNEVVADVNKAEPFRSAAQPKQHSTDRPTIILPTKGDVQEVSSEPLTLSQSRHISEPTSRPVSRGKRGTLRRRIPPVPLSAHAPSKVQKSRKKGSIIPYATIHRYATRSKDKIK